jgi:cobalt-precorrin 5A hydrolase
MVAGIGCRAGVSGKQVEAAIQAAMGALQNAPPLTAIATPATKAKEPGIRAVAVAWGVPLLAISQEALEAADPATVTRSAHSMAAMHVHCVAEAAAVAGAATKGMNPHLLQPRIVVGPVTCALAQTTTS